MSTDQNLYNLGLNAVAHLKRRYQQGTYRIIRDPDGVISLWAIECTEMMPFSVSFADQGRVSPYIEQMSPAFVKAFIDYVKRTTPR